MNFGSMVFAKEPIFIIAGEKQSGKTSFLLQLLRMLDNAGLTTAGFVSLHQPADDSYTLRNIQTQEEARLMQRIAGFKEHPHHFELFPEGIKTGMHWIQQILDKHPDIAVIDEIGSYELSGELWCEDFTRLVNAPSSLIFTTKTKHVEAIMERWDIEPAAIFYPDDFAFPEQAFEQIKNVLQTLPKRL